MTGNLDRYGEPLEDDDTGFVLPNEPRPVCSPCRRTESTRDEIHRDRCAQLRAIIRAARERREAQR